MRTRALLVLLLLVSAAAPANAQEQIGYFEGRVAWVAGQSMVVTLDTGVSVDIDLRRISQTEVRAISQGDYVIVTGAIERPGRRFLAISIRRVSNWYPQAP